LPRLEKLAAKYKDRPEVQFLTLNMDDNPGLIAPFMNEQQLSLTVLPAYNYVEDTLKVNGIPQDWIVDSGGVVRLKGVGYDATEKWEAGMTDALRSIGLRQRASNSAPASRTCVADSTTGRTPLSAIIASHPGPPQRVCV